MSGANPGFGVRRGPAMRPPVDAGQSPGGGPGGEV